MILELQIITTFIVSLWFDAFGIHRVVLKLFGKNPWDDFKPFSCYFCTSLWLNGCVLSAYASVLYFSGRLGTKELIDVGFCFMLNFVVSLILDRVLGYESTKGK